MSEWVQKCPFCGNCSGYLDDEVGELEKQLIASDRYQVTLNESSFPELARLFLALPLKHECKQKYSGAAREAIHAPWVCDDYERKMKARECRERESLALHRKAELKWSKHG